MNSFLKEIIARKAEEVSVLKSKYTERDFESQSYFSRKTCSLKEKLHTASRPCVISEYKRASPSLGVINAEADVVLVTQGYARAGAIAVSILTDGPGFSGSIDDVKIARPHLEVPILRKEFIIDPLQIFEAKAIGADVILLIAACLEKDQTKSLAKCAKSLDLEVLLEVHSEAELAHLNEYVDVLGVNNRDLHTFQVSFEPSKRISEKLDNSIPLISESGLKTEKEIFMLFENGYKGFLIGETFMKDESPQNACAELIRSLR